MSAAEAGTLAVRAAPANCRACTSPFYRSKAKPRASVSHTLRLTPSSPSSATNAGRTHYKTP